MSAGPLVPAADDSFAGGCLHISGAGGDFLHVTHRPPGGLSCPGWWLWVPSASHGFLSVLPSESGCWDGQPPSKGGLFLGQVATTLTALPNALLPHASQLTGGGWPLVVLTGGQGAVGCIGGQRGRSWGCEGGASFLPESSVQSVLFLLSLEEAFPQTPHPGISRSPRHLICSVNPACVLGTLQIPPPGGPAAPIDCLVQRASPRPGGEWTHFPGLPDLPLQVHLFLGAFSGPFMASCCPGRVASLTPVLDPAPVAPSFSDSALSPSVLHAGLSAWGSLLQAQSLQDHPSLLLNESGGYDLSVYLPSSRTMHWLLPSAQGESLWALGFHRKDLGSPVSPPSSISCSSRHCFLLEICSEVSGHHTLHATRAATSLPGAPRSPGMLLSPLEPVL